jgi:perosamine synthetase
MSNRISYTQPSITELEHEYVLDAVKNGWGAKCYDYINRFEQQFANYLGVKHALATSSCTGAMQLGLSASGVGAGDEVILADTNWIATVAPVVHLGANPVFVDILPDSWCLDPIKVEQAITPRTKAIIATHLYGNLCEMTVLRALAEKYQLLLIEDAAEALGSEYHGQKAGSIGTFGTFSFHGTKTMTTGEGGMFVTNDSNLYEHVLTLSNHGRSRHQTKQFWPDEIGYKFKMSNIQAALGCAQLERIDELVNAKRNIFFRYQELLLRQKDVILNPEPSGRKNSYWMPTLIFSKKCGIKQEQLINAFQQANIDARVFFWPLSSLPMFTPKLENQHAYDIAQRAINLPSFVDITQLQQSSVIAVVNKLIEE